MAVPATATGLQQSISFVSTVSDSSGYAAGLKSESYKFSRTNGSLKSYESLKLFNHHISTSIPGALTDTEEATYDTISHGETSEGYYSYPDWFNTEPEIFQGARTYKNLPPPPTIAPPKTPAERNRGRTHVHNVLLLLAKKGYLTAGIMSAVVLLGILCIAGTSISSIGPNEFNQNNNGSAMNVEKVLPGYQGTIVILGVGGFVMLVSILLHWTRKLVNKRDADFDCAFDTGGKVPFGLIVTSLVSQWTWAATLMESCTVAVKYGISGPFWYATGATVQILIFCALSLKMKIYAPGAKTFLQVIRHRFGSATHQLYCLYGMVTTALITAMVMLGGSHVLCYLIDGYTVELSAILLTTLICSYTMISRTGGSFYANYFKTVFLFILISIFCYKIYFAPSNGEQSLALGSMLRLYNKISELKGPRTNKEESYLTMLSQGGLIFGIISIVGNSSVYVDQTSWQTVVAAKPKEAIFGFLAAGLIWFALPFVFATACGLGFLALSAENGAPILSDSSINAGMVPAAIAMYIGGKTTVVLLIISVVMVVTSTGFAETFGTASILIYDIYMAYIKPYSSPHLYSDGSGCQLCGKKMNQTRPSDSCKCGSMSNCIVCKHDDRIRQEALVGHEPDYSCRTHGAYRKYSSVVERKQMWCRLWCSLAVLPLTLALQQTPVTLDWMYMFMGVLIGSASMPVSLALVYSKLTSKGMISGALVGTTLGLFSWLLAAYFYHEGGSFFQTTGLEVPMLVGNLVSHISGGLVTLLVSHWEIRECILSPSPKTETWSSTLTIDNPLYPWRDQYKKELEINNQSLGHYATYMKKINERFNTARKLAIKGSVIVIGIMAVGLPALMCALGALTYVPFCAWIYFCLTWGLIAGLCAIIAPIISELKAIRNMALQNP